jgi:hypothetical protein
MFSSVHSRYRLPVVGDKVWAISAPGHALPEGLPERRRLFILVLETRRATVGDANGKEWVLPYDNLETAQEFFLEEQWLPESDPRALAHVRAMIVRQQDQPFLEGVGEFAAEWLQRLRWILQRNGIAPERMPKRSSHGPSSRWELDLVMPGKS